MWYYSWSDSLKTFWRPYIKAITTNSSAQEGNLSTWFQIKLMVTHKELILPLVTQLATEVHVRVLSSRILEVTPNLWIIESQFANLLINGENLLFRIRFRLPCNYPPHDIDMQKCVRHVKAGNRTQDPMDGTIALNHWAVVLNLPKMATYYYFYLSNNIIGIQKILHNSNT